MLVLAAKLTGVHTPSRHVLAPQSFVTASPTGEANHPLRPRHFLADCGECRLSQLFLGFLFTHSPHDFTSPGRLRVNLDQVKRILYNSNTEQ